ncbi:hypothetical protein D3C78_1805150 [compost metagenome]
MQGIAHHHFNIEQIEQQTITVTEVVFRFGIDGVFQQRNAMQAELGRHGGGLANVVGLNGTGGNQGIGPLAYRIGG